MAISLGDCVPQVSSLKRNRMFGPERGQNQELHELRRQNGELREQNKIILQKVPAASGRRVGPLGSMLNDYPR